MLPDHTYPQQEITDAFVDVIAGGAPDTALLRRLHGNAGVRQRHLALPLEQYAELPTGRIAWQNRLSDRALDRVVATEDFTVARTSDESTVRLVVLDTFTGQQIGTMPFAVQPSLVPMNLAISADGTLVYTLPNALVLKDLYKPWNDPGSEKPIPGPVQQPPYTGATRPDQLVIAATDERRDRYRGGAAIGSADLDHRRRVRHHGHPGERQLE